MEKKNSYGYINPYLYASGINHLPFKRYSLCHNTCTMTSVGRLNIVQEIILLNMLHSMFEVFSTMGVGEGGGGYYWCRRWDITRET